MAERAIVSSLNVERSALRKKAPASQRNVMVPSSFKLKTSRPFGCWFGCGWLKFISLRYLTMLAHVDVFVKPLRAGISICSKAWAHNFPDMGNRAYGPGWGCSGSVAAAIVRRREDVHMADLRLELMKLLAMKHFPLQRPRPQVDIAKLVTALGRLGCETTVEAAFEELITLKGRGIANTEPKIILREELESAKFEVWLTPLGRTELEKETG